jgi:uncharacterized OB-fold protein
MSTALEARNRRAQRKAVGLCIWNCGRRSVSPFAGCPECRKEIADDSKLRYRMRVLGKKAA